MLHIIIIIIIIFAILRNKLDNKYFSKKFLLLNLYLYINSVSIQHRFDISATDFTKLGKIITLGQRSWNRWNLSEIRIILCLYEKLMIIYRQENDFEMSAGQWRKLIVISKFHEIW